MEVEEVNEEETEITELLVRHSCVYLIDHLSFCFFLQNISFVQVGDFAPTGPCTPVEQNESDCGE